MHNCKIRILVYRYKRCSHHVIQDVSCSNFLYPRDEIGVLEQVSGTSVSALIHNQIQQHVETTCKGNFETAYLEILEMVCI